MEKTKREDQEGGDSSCLEEKTSSLSPCGPVSPNPGTKEKGLAGCLECSGGAGAPSKGLKLHGWLPQYGMEKWCPSTASCTSVRKVGMTPRDGCGPWSTDTLLTGIFRAWKAADLTLGPLRVWADCQWKMLAEAKGLGQLGM